MSEKFNSTQVTRLNATSNVTLTNSASTTQYIFLKSDSTNTNHWRIYVDSDGKLSFDRFDGNSWDNKFQLT